MSSTAPSSDDAHTRAHDYDGTAAITFEAEQAFLKWFDEHGGQHPKILYPSRDTVNEVRGAVAVDDIHVSGSRNDGNMMTVMMFNFAIYAADRLKKS